MYESTVAIVRRKGRGRSFESTVIVVSKKETRRKTFV